MKKLPPSGLSVFDSDHWIAAHQTVAVRKKDLEELTIFFARWIAGLVLGQQKIKIDLFASRFEIAQSSLQFGDRDLEMVGQFSKTGEGLESFLKTETHAALYEIETRNLPARNLKP